MYLFPGRKNAFALHSQNAHAIINSTFLKVVFFVYRFDKNAYDARMRWYRDARFGMFIHWGLYALPARGEWVRSSEQMPEEEYLPYFQGFDPKAFDPKAWAALARKAGMRYAVLTAKHHDGFCLFDSRFTDFKSTNTPFGRDIVREFLDAFRAEGIRVGLYFSLLDWHHPDFPHYGDRHHPMRNNPAYSNEDRDLTATFSLCITKFGRSAKTTENWIFYGSIFPTTICGAMPGGQPN